MKNLNLRRFLKGLCHSKREVPSRTESSRVHLSVRPLTVGLRVDTTVRTGPETYAEVSQMIWVSPGPNPESVGILKCHVLPN